MNISFTKWQPKIPCLTEEDDWFVVEKTFMDYLLITSDQLIQFQSLHCLYYSPDCLFTLGLFNNNNCPGCSDVDRFHKFWGGCNRLTTPWEQVHSFLMDGLGLTVPRMSKVLLLGMVDTLNPELDFALY